MDDVHVAALVGSLRDASYTRRAVGHVLDTAEDAGATTDMIDLRTLDLPVYNSDEKAAGDADNLRERVAAADAILLATPVYHGSYSSVLKNALDYCSFDEFEDRTVGFLVVAGGRRVGSTFDHLRRVATHLHAWTLPTEMALPKVYDQFEGGRIIDEESADRLDRFSRELVAYGRIHPIAPEATID